MKKLFLISFLILSLSSYGNDNYQPGYILKLNNDTLHGLINLVDWDYSPRSISFKESMSENSKQYSVLDIKGFGVENEIYESAIVQSGITSTITNNLDGEAELKTFVDTVFLQIIVNGKKSLSFYKNKFGVEQFYTKTNNNFDLLTYKKYIPEQSNVILENKRYQGQLVLYLLDCSTIQTMLKYSEYSEKSLKKIFIDYYKCIGQPIYYQSESEKTIVRAGVVGGATETIINFVSDYYESLAHATDNSSFNFSGGAFVEFGFSGNRNKWSIYNEFLYNSYKVSTNYIDSYFSRSSITNATVVSKLEYSYLNLNILLRYRLPLIKQKWFCNGGFSYGIALSEVNSFEASYTQYGTFKSVSGKAIEFTKKNDFGLLLGLGTQVKKLTMEFRVGRSNGMSDVIGIQSPILRLNFLLGYTFN